MFDAIVLGSGVVGINTAYWLAKAGRKVLVLDRQPLAGNETSFANGGQISVSFAEPWANPGTLVKVAGWLFDNHAPLLFRPRPDPDQWRWLAGFIWQCQPWLYRRNLGSLVQLGLYSRHLLKQVRQEHDLQYQARENGILHFYRDAKSFENAKYAAALMRAHGCNRRVISTERAIETEPALQHMASQIFGATFTPEDESGDCHLYCQAMAEVCKNLGVTFRFNYDIEALHQQQGMVSVQVHHNGHSDVITAPQIVVALGSYSRQLLKPLGVSLNIYPAKGYSITVPMQNPTAGPQCSVTDDKHKVVFTPLGNELRMAGTAELSGYSTEINEERCERMVAQCRQLFPAIGGFERSRFWAGLRPATPSNVPYIGATRYPNLWLNTGHGTLGWTLGCGSGKVLADMICGERPAWQRQGEMTVHSTRKVYE
ncbi:MAG: D-amino acid dehydrogenase [Oceanospirillaceae bacterium]|nr:D-amino acid dehydrogenase [Oceanospirillaceae bacterium]MCP5335385.1 D-amino acid dehydrogenase [Oceanospirillaceae bacterium]MCP5351444.1 D-amino acid dehydrogenase [Oceanospirillaceae bacterium]